MDKKGADMAGNNRFKKITFQHMNFIYIFMGVPITPTIVT
jgi:hypothetical protein